MDSMGSSNVEQQVLEEINKNHLALDLLLPGTL